MRSKKVKERVVRRFLWWPKTLEGITKSPFQNVYIIQHGFIPLDPDKRELDWKDIRFTNISRNTLTDILKLVKGHYAFQA